jgi:predicted Zn-dependent peptidase
MIKKSILANGLTVVTNTNKSVQTMVAAIGVHVGNKNELECEIGLSHALEHLCFKGTETRTYEQINNVVECAGAYFNAYTSNEQTVYYIKGLKTHLEMAIDILSDQVQNSIFPDEETTKEMGVIVQEIKRSNDNPGDVVNHNFMKVVFDGSTLANPILGSKEQVLSYTPDDMRKYYKKHYQPSNMILSVAGNVDHKKVVKLAQKFFKTEKTKFKFKKTQKAVWHSSESLVHTDSQEQVSVVIGWKTAGRKASRKDRITISLISSILGSGMSSMLVEEVREKRGLSYSVSSGTDTFEELGLLAVVGGTDHEKLASFMDAVALVMRTFNEKVSDEQLQKVKNSYKTAIASGEESMSTGALSCISYLQNFDELPDTVRTLKVIDSVTLADVKRIMRKILSGRPAISIYGNAPQLNSEDNTITLEHFEKMLRIKD